LLRSDKFKEIYPDLVLKEDKDTKSNFKIMKKQMGLNALNTHALLNGGNRFSTSIGGSLTGFHGDIIIWDDPINPTEALSKTMLEKANTWIDNTLPTRKTNKANSLTIGIMQRVHQNDVTGHLMDRKGKNIDQTVLPGELSSFGMFLKPQSLRTYYKNGLLDPKRLNRKVLNELKTDLGQYGYAGQIGQHPTNPEGGMFKVDRLNYIETMPPLVHIESRVRYWDKAGTEGGGAYTTGVLIAKVKNAGWIIEDVVRGQWGTGKREMIIKNTAVRDGTLVKVYIEQEPGSGGKESAENTIRNLAGFNVAPDRPTGDKGRRADPFSVQVNNGNVSLLVAHWNKEFVDEMRLFPLSKYKDQVDASSAGFNMLVKRRVAGRVI
jgi:predicted phage terminase large subunit-like protein